MENNDDRDDNQRFALVLSWLQAQNNRFANEQGDVNFEREDEIELPNSDTNIENIFPRMTRVNQYEMSRELQERYQRIRAQVANPEQTIDENASEFEILTDDNSFVSSHCWHLSESSTPEISEPSKTDSDVYKSSSSNVEVEVHQPDEELPTTNDQSLKIYQDVHETDEDRILFPLRNNLLLRACILDLNDVPMSGPLATLVHNMNQFVFTTEESSIVLHFLRYRIVTTIQEINQRIDLLLQSQRDAQAELDMIESAPDESVDVTVSEMLPPIIEEAAENHEETTGPQSRDVCPRNNGEDSLEVASSIIIIQEPMDDMNVGYTLRVIEIFNEMSQLRKYRDKVALLHSKEETLNEDELRVIRNYLENIKSKRGFWYRLRKCCFRTRDRTEDPGQSNSLQLFSCWCRRRRRDL